MGCGSALVAMCPGCGHQNPPVARFCMQCGTSLKPSERPASAPARYTPEHLAAKILAARAGLEGERKQVTILFADVVGSTELIRDRDPEEAQQLLDGALQVMMD